MDWPSRLISSVSLTQRDFCCWSCWWPRRSDKTANCRWSVLSTCLTSLFFMICVEPTQPVISRFSSHLESLVSSLFLPSPPPPPSHPMVTETLFTGIPGCLLQKLQNYAARHIVGMLKVVPVAGRVARAPWSPANRSRWPPRDQTHGCTHHNGFLNITWYQRYSLLYVTWHLNDILCCTSLNFKVDDLPLQSASPVKSRSRALITCYVIAGTSALSR